jgi:hypothetical protein
VHLLLVGRNLLAAEAKAEAAAIGGGSSACCKLIRTSGINRPLT